MLFEFLINKFNKGEPIFLSEISGYSKDYIRQEMKRLTDEGKIERLYNGVYFIPYTTILGTKGKVSIDKLIEKKFLSVDDSIYGFYCGLSLANILGFTTQNPAYYEICSNAATTKQRKLNIEGINMIIYKPFVDITKENYKELQFLDLMSNIDKYSELDDKKKNKKLLNYVKEYNINFDIVKEYLPLYPDRVYKNIYCAGLMDKLI